MKNKTMIVNEIFGSIDGEGLRTGELATFIRLAGCNLRCIYCDTAYSLKCKDGVEMSIDEILEKVDKIGFKNITLTGGEPLIHRNIDMLIDELLKKGYRVNIETNGAVDITKYLDKDVLITMDYKTKYSMMEDKMILSNLEKLRENDVLKFVCSRNDLEDVKNILKKFNIKSYVYLSPVFKLVEPYELVDYLKLLNTEINTDKIRVQVQLHKIIWDANKRGV